MPAYYFETSIQKWIKECSCCHVVTEGTHDQAESLVIFSKMFAESRGLAQAADDLQSRCWVCNSAKRRALGVTRVMLEEMMAKQDSKCAICCREISIDRNALPIDKANVDHDEATDVIRELLCGPCNRGIGVFLHNPRLLNIAAEYCTKHEKIIHLKGFGNG